MHYAYYFNFASPYKIIQFLLFFLYIFCIIFLIFKKKKVILTDQYLIYKFVKFLHATTKNHVFDLSTKKLIFVFL